MPHEFNRRQFLIASSALGVAAAAPGAAFAAADAVRLLPSPDQDLFRVRMEMTLEGNVDVAKNVLVSKRRDRQLPITATSTIDFEERWTRDEQSQPAAARRYYHEAISESTIAGRSEKRQLRSDLRRVTAQMVDGSTVLYGETEYLTHDELNLLQTPLCPLAIDGVLPEQAIVAGDKWEPLPEALGRLLNLDEVKESTISGEVISISGTEAKLQLQGRIEGSVHGVSTAIDLASKMTFDRAAGVVTWIAVAMRERREIGRAEPGFEIAARVKLIRQPLESPQTLADATPVDVTQPPPASQMLVHVDSGPGKFTAFLSRQWRVISDTQGLTILRMISDDKAVAQCEVRSLVAMKPGEQLTLEAFQVDVRRSLAQGFGSFLEAEEGVNGGNLRTLRLAVDGQVEDVPVQWVFLHFSDDSGRRMAATFTLEASQVEIFGGSDAQLANSFQFKAAKTEAGQAQAAKPSETSRK